VSALELPSDKGHNAGMTEKHPKRPRDLNQWAKHMLDIATGAIEDREPTPEEQGKDPAAVSLGRRGGLKGGKARAESMTPERRREIAKAAARKRWGAEN
jgi:hypothetical protein